MECWLDIPGRSIHHGNSMMEFAPRVHSEVPKPDLREGLYYSLLDPLDQPTSPLDQTTGF